jgi:hypothetical protein
MSAFLQSGHWISSKSVKLNVRFRPEADFPRKKANPLKQVRLYLNCQWPDKFWAKTQRMQ